MLSRPLFGLQRAATWIACGGLFVLFFGLSGCSALNFNTKARFVVDQADNVVISTDAWTWEEGFHYQPEGTDSVVIKLDNSEAVHLIRAEKDGHYPMVTPLFPDFANPWKLLDLSLTIGGAATAAAGISQENRTVSDRRRVLYRVFKCHRSVYAAQKGVCSTLSHCTASRHARRWSR